MNEIKTFDKDKVVNVKQAEQEKQNILVGRLKPCKGHTLYEVNLANGEVNKAKFEGDTLQIATLDANPVDSHIKKKVMVNKGCIYVPALNVKNLIKKLIKHGYINEVL